MYHSSDDASLLGSAASPRPGLRRVAAHTGDASSAVVAVPLVSLRPADSPRLRGEDKAHIVRLAETETPLPPILVERRTLRVIDGMHRLLAASLQGRETIDVVFFDGNEADVFLHAVQENVTHGLPLSQADRRVAAERIIASHPHMSDRAIGQISGMAAKTVAALRQRSGGEGPQQDARVGRDGRVRPLDSGTGRQRAAEMLVQQPDASLRDVARAAGISPTTALDVRNRLERGESPMPGKQTRRTRQRGTDTIPGSPAENQGTAPEADNDSTVTPTPLRFKNTSQNGAPPDPATVVEKLIRDPSLRGSERGKGVLRVLSANAIAVGQLPDAATVVPPHAVVIIAQLARQYASMWQDFARELDGRARIIDLRTAARRE